MLIASVSIWRKLEAKGPYTPFVSVCSVNPKIGNEHQLYHLASQCLAPASASISA